MTTTTLTPPDHQVATAPIDVRVRLSALWTAVMFIFAYVDLFSLYRPDVRTGLEAGTVSVFTVDQTFLFFTTLYVVIPSLMVYLSLALPRRVNRRVNLVAAALYAVTILGASVGEWSYWILGSVVETALLAIVIHHAWTWRGSATAH